MTLTHGGVTPTLLFDTSDLQNTESLSKQQHKLIPDRDGVCMSMVIDWIVKSSQTPGGVTSKSELKSGLALSLAQTAYMLDTVGQGDAAFIDSQGASVNSSTTLKKKWYSTKKGRYQDVALACTGLIGYALLNIRGGGGHALGYRQKGGVVQFFDPNAGVLQFTSSLDFAKWFPGYVTNNYSDLLNEVELVKIKV